MEFNLSWETENKGNTYLFSALEGNISPYHSLGSLGRSTTNLFRSL
jgi:hypothetical protein